MNDEERSDLLHRTGDLAAELLTSIADRHAPGGRSGQYALDLAVDAPLVELLHGEGLGVLSEEAGEVDIDRGLVAVLDPVDGSTNAALDLPWYATSVCIVDDGGPLHSLVVDHVSGTRFEARRGGGATRGGVDMPARGQADLAAAVVAVNGIPPDNPPWGQFRCFGAAALDLCAVAAGQFGAYLDCDEDAHGVWDYLGAALVCAEVGVRVVDAFGRDLAPLDFTARRTPVAACDAEALETLVAFRRR